MARKRDAIPSAGHQPKVLMYARVSSKEQEKEGFSIPSQLKLLHAYASENKFVVVQEFVDVETAKESGRKNFEELVRYLKSHPSVRTVLVEKTDRLYRNFRDYVCLDDLDIEIHLVKEGVVLSRDSRSSEKFVHGIKVLMAKNYVDNLSEETRKGMTEKAEQGIWPSWAPLGYRNVIGPDGKKTIEVDPETAPIVSKLFAWYATGLYCLKDLREKAKEAGLATRKSGQEIGVSALHALLTKRIYTGDFDWKGRIYHGKHAPLVSHELWHKVQHVLNERDRSKVRGRKEFAFSGLMKCGHCGCAMVAQIQKGRYIYYRCTGYKQDCGEPFVREELIAEQFAEALGRLDFGEDVLDFLKRALRESHADERREHEEAVQQLQSEYQRLQSRLHAIYVDKLEGVIDKHFFEKLSNDWRSEQSKLLEQIAKHQQADHSYLEEGARLLELACRAKTLFERQSAEGKKQLLKLVLSNSTWKGGRLTISWQQPFDLIFETSESARSESSMSGAILAENANWRPRQDLNLRPTV